jgi:hypothetical protein
VKRFYTFKNLKAEDNLPAKSANAIAFALFLRLHTFHHEALEDCTKTSKKLCGLCAFLPMGYPIAAFFVVKPGVF